MGKQLTHKPLIEALVQLKWELKEIQAQVFQDPAYPLFIGLFYDQIKTPYEHREELPSAQVPDNLTPHIVKYRFRKSDGGWPLVQVGPGIATLNFTEDYHWDSFLDAAKEFYPKLLKAYSFNGQQDKPKFTDILLRYINAVEFNFLHSNIIDYLASKLHTQITLPEAIANSPNVSDMPTELKFDVTYPIMEPPGIAYLLFASGTRAKKPALVWELNISSTKENVPQSAKEFESWLIKAHNFIETCFFTLIEGDLENQFKGA